MEWAIAHNLIIRFFEAFVSRHILVVKEHQILLHLLSAKWYTFQPQTWYIIQSVLTLYDLEDNRQYEFKLAQLVDHVHLFGFIAGYQKRTYKEQDPVNIEAAELMGRLHDKLKAIGYEGHSLELYLVRLVFLLFADDTNIFEKGIFYDYLDLNTKEDGSDLAPHIAQLFEVLNTSKDKRFRNIDESVNAFPYVNGKLFEEHLPTAASTARCARYLWTAACSTGERSLPPSSAPSFKA